MANSASPIKKPTIDSLTTVNDDGSRYFLHPADVHGRFTFWKRLVALVLLAVYLLLPWIPINGNPAVFLDLAHRRFHLFGLTFAPQDTWLLFFFITGLAFSLFYITALFGRVWCGWTCPYTVFLEHLYRRVERLIEGDAAKRRKLDAAPWTASKVWKRGLKHGVFVLISFIIAHIFLSYFVSIPGLWAMMGQSPLDNLRSFGVILFFTGALYFSFAWFREQFCIILCPYGRFQSALTDPNTMVIGYDSERGEPRGKATDPNAGACVDCNRCVQVCPTGIDIRNGLQIECIGCAACVDACDEIMTKLDRPKGLVRYDSERGLAGKKTQWIRPRTILYSGFLALGLIVMSISILQITPLKAVLLRMPGSPYYVTETTVRNHFQIRVINKSRKPTLFRIRLADAPEGATITGANGVQELAAMDEQLFTALIETPKATYKGPFKFQLRITPEAGEELLAKAGGEFIGPNPELLNPSPKTP